MNLILQFSGFRNNNDRKDAVKNLIQNLQNSNLTKIYLFANKQDIIGLNNSKLVLLNPVNSYKDILNWCNANLKNQICILSNTNVILGSEIVKLKYINIAESCIVLNSFFNGKMCGTDTLIFKPQLNCDKTSSETFSDLINSIRTKIVNYSNDIKTTSPVDNKQPFLMDLTSIGLETKYRQAEKLDIPTDKPKVINNATTNKQLPKPIEVEHRIISKPIITVNETISNNRYKYDLTAIVTCVNYSDYLVLSLSKNVKLVDKILVVTSPTDLMTQRICKELNVTCLTTNAFYENGDVFNKGRAINEAISTLDKKEWILQLDADIILPDNFRQVMSDIRLDSTKLYGADRIHCETYSDYIAYIETKNVDNLRVEKCWWIGYFQLFNLYCGRLDINKPYPEISNDASMSDLLFIDKFVNKGDLNIETIHIGMPGVNWKGRESSRFLSDIDFTNYMKTSAKSNGWGVVDSKFIEYSKYGKLNIENQITFDYHRGSWDYSLVSLSKVNNRNGVMFDTFLEKNFSWAGGSEREYSEPWVGIMHNPVNSPKWYLNQTNNKSLFESNAFIKSLKYCRGLYVFSEYEREQVIKKISDYSINVDVNVIRHPSLPCKKRWSIDNYKKTLCHIGWWLRDVESFYKLKTNMNKIRVKLNTPTEEVLNKMFDLKGDVTEVCYLNNEDYDSLLCSSVIFVNFIDCVANNTVVECIERQTPILVNRHPSVVYYLGEDYPLYYDSIDNIDSILTDDNIYKAHTYLKNIKCDIDLGKQIENSNIYKSLPNLFNLDIKTLFNTNSVENAMGGVYNPGYVRYNNRNIFLPRIEYYTEKERGVDGLWKRTSAIPMIIETDDNFNTINITKLNIPNYTNNRIEDFRLFEHNGEIYTNFTYVGDSIEHRIAKIDLDKGEMSILPKITLDFNVKSVEKNWTFISIDGILYMIYSLSPLIVLRVDLETMICKTLINNVSDITWNVDGYISCSTNPILYDDDTILMGFHSRSSDKIYHQGLLLFDKKFNIIKYNKSPYISGGDYDGINNNVIYTSSLLNLSDKLICFAGDGDYKSILIELKKDKLWND